ncbi:hypothetical protein [Rhizohabitans arisaemae]|uniref:hypothetical protein n=1 Tax=Rhizohabitans arisaemae TaxID=2720610 RepID=UPI0024B24359|nr:hypothetical protein [Rhizohabitans arisaemae]
MRDYESLSSEELHDLAVRRAVRHADFGFLWELLKAIPAAEAVSGHPDATTRDLTKLAGLISDAMTSGKGDIAEALRPFYLHYLMENGS